MLAGLVLATRLARGAIGSIGPALVAATALGPAPAAAAPRQVTYRVSGTVATLCSLGNQAAPISFSTVVPSNGKLDPNLSNLSWTLSGLYCDSASKISLKATALRLKPPRASLTPSQTQTVNFTATATGWTTSPATVKTAETSALGTGAAYTGTSQVQATARTGSITIKVGNFIASIDKSQSANTAKPIDGSYSATISVILSPNS